MPLKGDLALRGAQPSHLGMNEAGKSGLLNLRMHLPSSFGVRCVALGAGNGAVTDALAIANGAPAPSRHVWPFTRS